MALKIKLVKSLNGRGDKQIATAHSMGLPTMPLQRARSPRSAIW